MSFGFVYISLGDDELNFFVRDFEVVRGGSVGSFVRGGRGGRVGGGFKRKS